MLQGMTAIPTCANICKKQPTTLVSKNDGYSDRFVYICSTSAGDYMKPPHRYTE